jgi:hypothetical protein
VQRPRRPRDHAACVRVQSSGFRVQERVQWSEVSNGMKRYPAEFILGLFNDLKIKPDGGSCER